MKALCQCSVCGKYLVRDRHGTSRHNNECRECLPNEGIPLAEIRGTLTTPLDLELLGLMAEECAEVIQRIGKIIRWGWSADFHGSSQKHKLQVELADVLVILELLDKNGIVKYQEVMLLMEEKLEKFREDAEGPKQRLLHAEVP